MWGGGKVGGQKRFINIKIAFSSISQVVHYTIPHTFLYDLNILFQTHTLIGQGTCFPLHAVAGPPPGSVPVLNEPASLQAWKPEWACALGTASHAAGLAQGMVGDEEGMRLSR